MERLAEVVIVPAGPADAAALARVHVASWKSTYPGLLPQEFLDRMNPQLHARRWRRQLTLARPGEAVMAAEGVSGLVGYCQGAAGGEEGEVFTLYLLKSVQNAGLGRRLLTATARVMEAQGARTLRLWVLKENAHARRFYHHLGGRLVGQRPVSGWGGGLLEVCYLWPRIGALTG